jgi:hypothetical protein
MLYCPGGTTDRPRPYALCFFSGPPVTTGVPGWSGAPKNTLTCTPDYTTGFANCQCQVYNTGPYYVAMNGILNRGAFYQTQKECGHEGSGCKNIAACDENGKQKINCADGPCPTCPERIATVCEYIGAQGYDKEKAFYPQSHHSNMSRVDLISTFSFAMGGTDSTGPYQLGSTSCDEAFYAGCMTAACAFPDGSPKTDGSIVNCACPLWQGKYQMGQPEKNLPSSTLCPTNQSWVWSAAYAVKPQKSDCAPADKPAGN